MKLTIGILRSEPGWEILLKQIGVEWQPLSPSDELTPEKFSTVIVNSTPTAAQKKALLEYVTNGGTILAEYGSVQHLVNCIVRKKYFSSLVPNASSKFTEHEMLDIYSSVIVEANLHNNISTIHRIGMGTLISIPFDVNTLMDDARSRRKNFYYNRARLPNETVATVSKGALRRTITRMLEFLHHQRQIPFVHKWYFPEQQETVFTFRVDSDKGSMQEVNELYAVCNKHEIRTMWFVDTKSHEQWISRFRDFGNQEVGVHCYDHMTFTSVQENSANFSKALSVLNGAGIFPGGASAPYGSWNPAIETVFERLGFAFSSEFGIDYDDLPFSPFVNDKFSSVLQLPIHPICTGSMRRAGFSEGEMKKYFRQIIDLKISQQEPICLYHHPTHHHSNVLEDTFEYLRTKRIKNISYSHYAEWWRRRDEEQSGLEFDSSSNVLYRRSSMKSSDVQWRVFFPNGEESIITLEGSVNLDAVQRHRRKTPPLAPADIARTRHFDYRHSIMNILDAWHKRRQ